MKKGFTLIELLAVIIILAIIAIIATPIITDVIESSKESANLRSIEGYASAIKQKYYNDSLGGAKPTIDSNFLSNIDTSGGEVKCDSVLYNNGPILYKCSVQNSEKKYCYANEQHYACDNEDYLAIFTGSGGVETKGLISTLLEQYSEDNTTGLVKDATNENLYYYTGTNEQVANNFLWYGGHQWRVLEFDTSANTLTLITQQPLTAIQPSSAGWENKELYESSYINQWLNDYFWNSLDSSIQSNILDNTFNVGIYTDVDEITATKKVGLLDNDQYVRAGSTDSYLDIKDFWWLGNRYSSSYVRYVDPNGYTGSDSPSNSLGVRAVIKISDITITGDGTLASNYQVGNKATDTNNVQVGEYINVPYSGSDSACGSDNMCTFRVVSKDSDSIKVVLNGLLPTTSQYGSTTTISTSHTIYSPLNTFAEGISDTYRYTNNKTFNIGDYPYVSGTGQNYKDVQDETLEASVGLPILGEMFSGNDIDMGSTKTFVDVNTIENPTVSGYYWTMNRYSSSSVRDVSDYGSSLNSRPSFSSGVRAVIYLKSGTSAITFTGGEGTPNSPYVLQ